MNDSAQRAPDSQEPPPRKLNPLQVIASVLAAGLGVQSSKNRERDFKQGRIGIFIAAGIIFTLVFIASVMFVVQTVIKNAGQ
ncbi:Uncharacterised protein [Halioglobus japonicus]|nr:Uncharacterised protein [Halioglobus japonicus]